MKKPFYYYYLFHLFFFSNDSNVDEQLTITIVNGTIEDNKKIREISMEGTSLQNRNIEPGQSATRLFRYSICSKSFSSDFFLWR